MSITFVDGLNKNRLKYNEKINIFISSSMTEK